MGCVRGWTVCRRRFRRCFGSGWALRTSARPPPASLWPTTSKSGSPTTGAKQRLHEFAQCVLWVAAKLQIELLLGMTVLSWRFCSALRFSKVLSLLYLTIGLVWLGGLGIFAVTGESLYDAFWQVSAPLQPKTPLFPMIPSKVVTAVKSHPKALNASGPTI